MTIRDELVRLAIEAEAEIIDLREQLQTLREQLQYNALTEYQRGAYDYLGQRGHIHSECLEAAYSI